MHRLIDDLLRYSRTGRAELARTAVSAAEVVDETMRSLAAEIESSGARVEHDELPVVEADPVLLGQVFQNLVSNAVKFRDDEPPVVRVSGRELPDSWEFTVQDNGIGIPQERAEQIFKMFQRLHHRDQYDGTGIGLSVCQRIVERHGGRIRVEPVGSGARQPLRLHDRQPTESGGHRLMDRPLCILHAEDDPGDAQLTRLALDENGPRSTCTTCPDGEQALRFLRREGEYADAPRPDIVLLDLNMPRLGGHETL